MKSVFTRVPPQHMKSVDTAYVAIIVTVQSEKPVLVLVLFIVSVRMDKEGFSIPNKILAQPSVSSSYSMSSSLFPGFSPVLALNFHVFVVFPVRLH